MNEDLQPLDYTEIRALAQSDHQLFNPDVSLYENAQEAFTTSVLLPNPEIQLPILSAFACLPTALINTAPILCILGRSGSGKSQILKILAALNGTTALGSSSSFVSIRNEIKSISFLDEIGELQAPNYQLVFDDAKADFVEDPDRFAILRYGYDRSTSIVTISGPISGQNLRFQTFCPKAFSTTDSFIFEARFAELRRRSLLLRSEKQSDNPMVDELIPPDEVDYRALRNAIRYHWLIKENCEHFVQIHRYMKRTRSMFDSDQWTIYRPIASTLCALTGMDPNEAKEAGKAFFDLQEDETPPLRQILIDELQDNMECHEERIKHDPAAPPYSVPTAHIKNLIESAKRRGSISDSRLEAYQPEMEQLGWRLRKNNKGEISWVYGT